RSLNAPLRLSELKRIPDFKHQTTQIQDTPLPRGGGNPTLPQCLLSDSSPGRCFALSDRFASTGEMKIKGFYAVTQFPQTLRMRVSRNPRLTTLARRFDLEV